MISLRHQCIFVEIPKTGSTSIRRILGAPQVPHLDIWEIRRLMMSQLSDDKLRTERLRAGFYSLLPVDQRRRLGLSRFERFFKFGFVRNPWDRIVSLYSRQEGDQSHRAQSFTEFVRGIRYSSATCIHPSPHVNQLDRLVDPSGHLAVDYIGRFETLERDWRHICGRIGIADLPLPVTKKNKNKSDHYSSFYTDETRHIVAERFRADIEFFAYEFEQV